MMTREEYDDWWIDNTGTDGELHPDLPEPVATLAAHVAALQDRIDRSGFHACACAYDHPDARCSPHQSR